ncbi:MAG TPA: toll/interleukin-1 receptor domain-containing protein [Albitalea sp.]|uniref:toll/interleukin-1 receptor domain-containing protein n=1 Tax=Piscinibacter sp. TaxID=1903157 RepID=UPI002ED46154
MIKFIARFCFGLFTVCCALGVLILCKPLWTSNTRAVDAVVAVVLLAFGLVFLVIGVLAHDEQTVDGLFKRIQGVPFPGRFLGSVVDVKGARGEAAQPSLIFVSYSHVDEEWKKRLETHLAPGLRDGRWKLWTDRRIEPGEAWEEEIMDAIDRSSLAISLVSPEYLASPFVMDRELPALMHRHRDRHNCTWVHIRASSWEKTLLKGIQAAYIPPDPPLDQLSRPLQDAAFVAIVNRILG